MRDSIGLIVLSLAVILASAGRAVGAPDDGVRIRIEAEDAVDYTFIPGYFPSKAKPPAAGLSGGRGLHLGPSVDLLPNRTYAARYEYVLPKKGEYEFAVRLGMLQGQEETFDLQWRADMGDWQAIDVKAAAMSRTLGQVKSESGDKLVEALLLRLGRVALGAGVHTLTIQARPLSRPSGFLTLDAFYVATVPIGAALVADDRAWIASGQLLARIPVEIAVHPARVVTEHLNHLNRGVAIYGLRDAAQGKTVSDSMKAIGVNFTRTFDYQGYNHPAPDFQSSSHSAEIASYLKNHGIADPKGFMSEALKNPRILKKLRVHQEFLQYLQDGRITFSRPGAANWRDWDGSVQELIRYDRGITAIMHSEKMPLWLSEQPARLNTVVDGATGGPEARLYPPNDPRAYAALWTQDLRHMNETFPGVVKYWEVHNEPNLDQFFRVPLGPGVAPADHINQKIEAYLRMYSAAAMAVQQSGLPMEIGGPALSGPDYVWIAGLARHCAANKLRLDFASWHMYDYQPMEVGNAVRDIRDILKANGIPNAELIIDEWNVHGSADRTDYQYRLFNSNYNAALSAATLAAMMQAGLDHAVFFYDRDQLDATSFGLLAPDGRKKPVYFAFDLFNRLGDRQIKVDQSSQYKIGSLATVEGNQVRLLLWNYDPTESVARKVRLSFDQMDVVEARRYLIDAAHSRLGDTAVALAGSGADVSEITLNPNAVMLVECTLSPRLKDQRLNLEGAAKD